MAGFTIDEARAGHALAERDVARAEENLARAQGRRERREAEAAVERARSVRDVSRTILEKVAKDLGVTPFAPAAAPATRTPEARVIEDMSFGDALQALRSFGEARSRQGDEFLENDFLEGAFFYATGPMRVGISVWGDDDEWALSIYSAARVRLRPSLELYRFISRWRTTAGAGAPYVVESDGEASIMCERLFQGSQFANDVTGWRMIASTIDLVGEAAQAIARYLANNPDGSPFTATGFGGMMALRSWWEVSDPGITEAVNRS